MEGPSPYDARYRYAAKPLPILDNHNPFPLLLSSMEKAHAMISPNERERGRNTGVKAVCRCVALTNTMPIREGSPPETNMTSPPPRARPHPNPPRPNHTLGFLLDDTAIGLWRRPLTSPLLQPGIRFGTAMKPETA